MFSDTFSIFSTHFCLIKMLNKPLLNCQFFIHIYGITYVVNKQVATPLIDHTECDHSIARVTCGHVVGTDFLSTGIFHNPADQPLVFLCCCCLPAIFHIVLLCLVDRRVVVRLAAGLTISISRWVICSTRLLSTSCRAVRWGEFIPDCLIDFRGTPACRPHS